jgi:coenzyme PQQ precursor peptide PqqA
VIEDEKEKRMIWTSPIIREVCVGMEIAAYRSAEP